MNLKVLVGLIILVLFGLFIFCFTEIAMPILYIYGCAMFGWNINSMSTYILKKLGKEQI